MIRPKVEQKINSTYLYTAMFKEIHSPLVDSFVKAMPKNVLRVADVAPFNACFNSTNIAKPPVGLAVPNGGLGAE